jgi:hypothetical protein
LDFMKRSISDIRKKRGRGRPKVGAVPVIVRLLPDQAIRLDKWRGAQTDHPGRPEAIRRLLERGLSKSTPSVLPNKETARKASTLAAREIENLGDTSQPLEEQQRRKRHLIRGPREFREIRADLPKAKR